MILAALALVLSAQDVPPPSPISTPVGEFSETVSGQPIRLPQASAVARVMLVEIPAGGRTTEHFHPDQRYAYVLSGRLQVRNLDTGVTAEFAEGAFLVEATGQWHQGFALDDAPVRLLVIDQSAGSSTSNTISRPSP